MSWWHRPTRRGQGTSETGLGSLDNHVLPVLRRLTIGRITGQVVVDAMRPQRVCQVLMRWFNDTIRAQFHPCRACVSDLWPPLASVALAGTLAYGTSRSLSGDSTPSPQSQAALILAWAIVLTCATVEASTQTTQVCAEAA